MEPFVDDDGFFVRREAGAPATSIYYLISATNFPRLHRLPADQTYHHFAGDAAELVRIDPSGALDRAILESERSLMVASGVWQGLRLKTGGRWALVGATVPAEFDWRKIELGRRSELTKAYPKLRSLIARFTRVR